MEDAVRLGALSPAPVSGPAAGAASARPDALSPGASPAAAAGVPLRLWGPRHLRVFASASLLLCLCDALFTLALIDSNHFYEANPVMDSLMRVNTWLFVATKLMVTAISLAVLLRYSGRTLFGRLRVAHLLFGTFGMYAVLVSYEVAMLTVVL